MRLLGILIAFLACSPVFAAEPFGRASIEGADGIVPGQQVHVVVDVFVPDFFTSPPQFPLFEVPDAMVTLSSERAVNMLQTIDGVQYSGIRRNYSVVPEKAGFFPLPKIGIELGFSVDGNPVKAQVTVALPTFDVATAADPTAAPFAARSLTIAQSFDRDPATLRAGDAIVRTIVVSAEDTQAMLMPPVVPGDVAGVARYVKAPVLADGVEQRGAGRNVGTQSVRSETIVYTTASEGSFSLPAISYPWFDVDAHESATATLPAVTLLVATAATTKRISPTLEDKQAPSSGASKGILTVLLLGAIDLAIALFAWRRFGDIRAAVDAFRGRRRNNPKRRLRRLRTVIGVGPEDAIYRALQDWSRRLGHRTVAAWVAAEQNPRLAAQVAILERRLFRSRDAQLDRTALASAINLPTMKSMERKGSLPDLNPSAERPLLPPLLP